MSLSDQLTQLADQVSALEREVRRLRVENKSLRASVAAFEACDSGEPWTVLGITRDATEDAIGKAFRTLSRRFHPDNRDTGDAAKFQEVVDARAAMLQRSRRR